MRIAIISSLFPPYGIGGAEQMASQLALALHKLGHQVDVISTGRRTETDSWQGIRVWRIAPWNVYWSFDKQQERPGRLARATWHAVDLWNPSVLEPLRQALDSIRPEVVNTHNIDGLSPAVWHVAREYTAATVHTLHDYHLVCPRATMRRGDGSACEQLCGFCRAYARYHRHFQKHVRMLAAPASRIVDAHRLAGWTEPEARIIPNAVDVDAIESATTAAGGPLRVLFLSRLVREKGCETLLAALELMRDARQIEFHVAGRGEYEAKFRRSAAIWHGFVEGREKHELFRCADVFLQISECHDNAPLALIEAKCHGLYVVGTEIGGIPELIDVPAAGRLVPPADPEALAAALADLSGCAGQIRSARADRLRSNAGYGTREMAGLYLEAFESLLR